MKKTRLIFTFVFVLAVAFSLSVFAMAANEQFSEDPLYVMSAQGYPRMVRLYDGTLFLTAGRNATRSTDNGATWSAKYVISTNAATSTVYNGETYALDRANFQPFLINEGTANEVLILTYRAEQLAGNRANANGKYYTSLRMMTSTDGGYTFANEQVIIETSTDTYTGGYWEPFMVQTGADKVQMYYADDLSPDTSTYYKNLGRQYIMRMEYTISTGAWSNPSIVVNGNVRQSRDGMPVVTKLSDGNYAMVIETFDYLETYNSVFVVDILFSRDGIEWTSPRPIAAQQNYRSAAPYIVTLPDGRIAVSYQSDHGYTGNPSSTETNSGNLDIMISKTAVTYDNYQTSCATATSVNSTSFVTYDFVMHKTPTENMYSNWNGLACYNGYLFGLSGVGYNAADSTAVAAGTFIRRLQVATPDTITNAYREYTAISTPEDLMKIGVDADYPLDGSYCLSDDIDLSEVTQHTIGSTASVAFKGVFDGRGYTISGIDIGGTADSSVRYGLFGYLSSGIIRNLNVAGSVNQPNSFVGGLVGAMNSGKIENCHSAVNVTGLNQTGGLVGAVYAAGTAYIENCSFSGTVSGTNYVGGIVGHLRANTTASDILVKVDELKNSGTVTATGNNIGGISGEFTVRTSTLYDILLAKDLYNYGTVSCTTTTAGNNVGGIFGAMSYAKTENIVSTGNVTGYATVGGLVGSLGTSGSLKYGYSKASVTGGNACIGANDGSITGLYYTGGSDANATAVSASAMGNTASYPLLDFTNDFTMGTYPMLKSFPCAHNYLVTSSVPVTCLADGSSISTCTICGDVVTSIIPKTGHTASGTWVVTTEATAQESGTRVQYCTVCGEIALSESISYLFGDANIDGVVDANDALVMLKHINGWTTITIDTGKADVNADSKIGLVDVLLVLKKAAGWDITLGVAQ